jgi:hypothetical protein
MNINYAAGLIGGLLCFASMILGFCAGYKARGEENKYKKKPPPFWASHGVSADDDMRAEYDFKGGQRGKYAASMNRIIDAIGLVTSGNYVAIDKFTCPNGHCFVEATNVGEKFLAVCPWCRAQGASDRPIPGPGRDRQP